MRAYRNTPLPNRLAARSTTDRGAGDVDKRQSSGVLDPTHLFEARRGEPLFVAGVQAHGSVDGVIGGNGGLSRVGSSGSCPSRRATTAATPAAVVTASATRTRPMRVGFGLRVVPGLW